MPIIQLYYDNNAQIVYIQLVSRVYIPIMAVIGRTSSEISFQLLFFWCTKAGNMLKNVKVMFDVNSDQVL